MSIRITRPRFKRALNDSRCELAEARARAARSLAKLHSDDGTWLGWLASEHYRIAKAKWMEYLRAEGEERKVARYEFLINLKSWLELLPMPLETEVDSYRKGSLYIAGFFGEDAFVISHARGGKRYRLLCDSTRQRRNDPYLRYPGSERFILPDGDDLGLMDTSNATRDRMVCLHDAFVLFAVTRGDKLLFRFVGANDKYSVFPSALEKDLSNFVGKKELVERIKREIKVYGDGEEEQERVDELLCGPNQSELYQPKSSSSSHTLHALNQNLLDSVDPLAPAPSLTKRWPAPKDKETGKIVAKGNEDKTTAKHLVTDNSGGDSAVRSRHGTKRVTSRKVITNAMLKREIEIRQEEDGKKKKKGLTAFFEGILDDVDPLSVRPSLRKKNTGNTTEMRHADELADEFLHHGDADAEGEGKGISNRVISNFSRKVTNSTARVRKTRRPSGDVTTAMVRRTVRQRNASEKASALLRLQEDLDRFFDARDPHDVSIQTSLHHRKNSTQILQMHPFQSE